MREEYQELLPFCQTERQREVIEALASGLSLRKAAKQIGINNKSLTEALKRVRRYRDSGSQFRDAKQHINNVPPAYNIKGTSTFYNLETGEPVRQWVKTDLDKERQAEIMRQVVDAMNEEIQPVKRIKCEAKKHNSNLLNLYTLTDFHLGCLAWEDETGENWDLDIAERLMVQAFDYLIQHSPDAEVGFFNEQGDFEHYDSHLAITPMNKHILDADGRPTKMIRASIRVQRQVIEMMAKKYKKVVVLNAEGNHNIIASAWKRELFAELYRNNPRIEVITDVLPYYAYEWGQNMLGIHHGHLKGMKGLPDVFIARYREMYGRTKRLHIHTGHQHHHESKETTTAIVEMHPTLAAMDAYGARSGFVSQRAMQCITYHKDFLETGRVIFRPEML